MSQCSPALRLSANQRGRSGWPEGSAPFRDSARPRIHDGIVARNVLDTDLSGDGLPEVVFASYSTDLGKGALYILDAAGNLKHKLALPRRGAMPVPTLADVNGDGTVEILVSLKDALDKVESVLVYTVPGSSTNCLTWPTGRGNLLRNGWLRSR